MKDIHGKIIYIGKAKNLYNRVHSYFSKDKQDIKTELLVQKIHSVAHITTLNEKDALILENQLIKQHLPYYNILLKDGKSYIRLSIDYRTSFPRLQLTREKTKKRVRYFGPFPNAKTAKSLIDIGEKLFRLRRCNVKITQPIDPKTKPCMLYDLKICPGACIGKDTEEDYKQRLKQMILFLKGGVSRVKKEITTQMEQSAQHLNFEKAAYFRDLLFALDDMQVQQKIYFESSEVIDIWGYFDHENKSTFVLLRFNQGVLEQKRVFHIRSDLPTPDIVEAIISRVYGSEWAQEEETHQEISLLEQQILGIQDGDSQSILNHKILFPINISEEQQATLSGILQSNTHIVQNSAHWKDLLLMASENATTEWKSFYKITHGESALVDLKQALNLQEIPSRIEFIDISNIGEHFAVGSCVVLVDSSPSKSDYRYYKIRYIKEQNDFAMIQEILLRRFKNDTRPMPQLLVIDGGKGQVSAAQEILQDMGIRIPFIGLAKREELIILPYQNQPIRLKHTSAALRVLMLGRDEAHRFANKLRVHLLKKKTLHSIWDDIPRIPKQIKKTLSYHFSTVEEFQQTPLDTIQNKTNLDTQTIQKILNAIRS